MSRFHSYRWNQLKVIPWTAESVQEVTFIQLVAALHPDANYF